MTQKYLTPEEVSLVYNIPVNTLSQWRVQGIGPCYYKLGAAVRYKITDMDEFMETNRMVCVNHRK